MFACIFFFIFVGVKRDVRALGRFLYDRRGVRVCVCVLEGGGVIHSHGTGCRKRILMVMS